LGQCGKPNKKHFNAVNVRLLHRDGVFYDLMGCLPGNIAEKYAFYAFYMRFFVKVRCKTAFL
jgi:hypothetical protein